MHEYCESEQLQDRFPQLAEQWDNFYRKQQSDSQAAAISARILIESLVKILYSELNLKELLLPKNEKIDLFNLLKGYEFRHKIPEYIQDRLHAIRIVGNAAAHQAENLPKDKIALISQDLDVIKTWFCQYFHLSENTTPNDTSEVTEPSHLAASLQLKDFYQDHLTDDQCELLNRLTTFLDSPDQKVFILRGYAGTGKTFILKGLTQYLELKKMGCVLLATTGKAARVFSAAVQLQVKTIHSHLYDEPVVSDDLHQYFPLKENQDVENAIYIIDESSMIGDLAGDETSELVFGSGQLLSDLMLYTELNQENSKHKIIFVGDDAQLPPVNMRLSPALCEKYLQTHFSLSSQGFTLKQVLRQKADSGILKNAGALRESIDHKDYSHLNISTETKDVIQTSAHDWLTPYLITCNHQINDNVIWMAHTNLKVNYYNRSIRSHFFPNCKTICAGDKVIVSQNNRLLNLFNGDMLMVKHVYPNRIDRTVSFKTKQGQQTVTLRFCEVTLERLDTITETVSAKDYLILEDFLYREKPKLTKEERRALEVDFRIRHPGISDPKELAMARQEDTYINAVRLRFGYAITTHKAQGSQWPFTFVDCDAAMSTETEDYFRWLYTAFTRTQNKLFILNPRSLSAPSEQYRHLQESDLNRINQELQQLQSKPDVREHQPWDDEDFCPFDCQENTLPEKTPDISQNLPEEASPASCAANVSRTEHGDDALLEQASVLGIEPSGMPMQIFRTIEHELRHTDIHVASVQSHPWQQVYSFIGQNCRVDVDIWYNKKNTITRIQMRSHNALEEQLNKTLKKLMQPQVQKNFSFSEKFLEALFIKAKNLAEREGVHISYIENQSWKQRYSFTYQNESLRIDFFYNKHQQITKWAPVCPNDRNHACFPIIERIANECLAH